ncbi:MAG: DUF2164 domain-containing protein [Pseudomonadales bacterium]|nr:DUF2164 domain-containing protein [Pseudomonadales bacterium]MCP5329940.1 DUF2164 domain-containing protein [Pseudomonadales bacterium]MCP5343203.1 DUF2164 domain-containing protein [Pseudomonadales bacterium]
MTAIEFSETEKRAIVSRIQAYFEEELEQEIGQFDAQFLLDFFAGQIGPYFYNRGLYDAQTILGARMEDISEAILQLEKATESSR